VSARYSVLDTSANTKIVTIWSVVLEYAVYNYHCYSF